MSLQDNLILYSYWRSSCSWRVRIALELHGLQYKYKAVHLKNGEQLLSDYSNTVNSMKQVPVLQINSDLHSQSLAIIELLNEKYSHITNTNLIGNTINDRSKVRRISEIINSGIQPIQNLSVLLRLNNEIKNAGNKNKLSKLDIMSNWAKETINIGFIALENVLKNTSGKYCVGDNITMADCCLVPQVFNAQRYNVDFTKFPNIKRINDNCMKVKAFQLAHPDNMPDAPKQSKL